MPCRWQAPHKGLEKEAHLVSGIAMGHTVAGACIVPQRAGEKKEKRSYTHVDAERERAKTMSVKVTRYVCTRIARSAL